MRLGEVNEEDGECAEDKTGQRKARFAAELRRRQVLEANRAADAFPAVLDRCFQAGRKEVPVSHVL